MAKKTDAGWPTNITDRFTSEPGGFEWISDPPDKPKKKKTSKKNSSTKKKK